MIPMVNILPRVSDRTAAGLDGAAAERPAAGPVGVQISSSGRRDTLVPTQEMRLFSDVTFSGRGGGVDS